MILGEKRIQFAVSQPVLVGKAKDVLQFSLLLIDCDSGRNIMELKGWTIKNHNLDPPTTRSSKGLYFNTIISSDRFIEVLKDFTREAWKVQYPSVLFPIQVEEEKGQTS